MYLLKSDAFLGKGVREPRDEKKCWKQWITGCMQIYEGKKRVLTDKGEIAGTVTGCYRILDGNIIINVNY